MSGWETARLLRANRAAPLPIVVISADSYEKDHGDSAGIAPEDFLVKPVSIARLLERIRERLDLIWIARSEETGAGDALAAAANAAGPSALDEHDLQALRVLGDLGHVRGILTKLDEIDRLDSRNGAFTARLREHVQAFRLPEYMSLLTVAPGELVEAGIPAAERGERGGGA